MPSSGTAAMSMRGSESCGEACDTVNDTAIATPRVARMRVFATMQLLGCVRGVNRGASVLVEGEHRVRRRIRHVHPRGACGHPWRREPEDRRALPQEAPDVFRRHVPLDHVAAHERFVARLEPCRNLVLDLD